ncbi:MAG TPA: helix-turn-helix domain-containing protein [Acidimicrobiales bacterium]|nr:helix-turn-helix domain-containing protein [Acidimicrobiales bacterium]
MPEEFESKVSGIAILNDPVRRSLYQVVVRSREPVSRDEAAEAVGVQRSLAAFHLDKLAEEGLLEVTFKRLTGLSGPGAGRPAKLYHRSERELQVSVPPRQYDLAAQLLAAAVDGASEANGDVRKALERVAFEFGRQLGEDAEGRSRPRPSPAKRRDAVLEVLREHGFEPRTRDGEIVLGNCPFHALAQQFTDLVCGMNLHLMSGLRSAVGLREGAFQPRLDPEPGMCCVRFGGAA